ncbi:MAG: hypothetical protein LRY63_09270 [Nitrincola sp.]|nr:hypothetical protein [Nitrincola sp.]
MSPTASADADIARAGLFPVVCLPLWSFSNLSIWLRDEGVSRTDIGLFALAATPYAINFSLGTTD